MSKIVISILKSKFISYHQFKMEIEKQSIKLTWSILRFGSGEMTVLPEKSTLFPDKFPLNLPCFPLSLWQNPRIGFFG